MWTEFTWKGSISSFIKIAYSYQRFFSPCEKKNWFTESEDLKLDLENDLPNQALNLLNSAEIPIWKRHLAYVFEDFLCDEDIASKLEFSKIVYLDFPFKLNESLNKGAKHGVHLGSRTAFLSEWTTWSYRTLE